MLLVAITGPVGSEKSTQLREFAESASDLGYAVDGFVSVAGRRSIANKGADSYTLRWVKTKEETLFATRSPESGYSVEPTTIERLKNWSTNLPKQDVIVLDEFGKWEAEGNGLIDIWQGVEQSSARMVCVTLRAGVQAEVEGHLHRKFDVVLSVNDTTNQDLIIMLKQLRDWERIGVYGAGSGGVEWTIGSWLHAIKFPFTGTVMGSIQASMLAIASEKLGRKSLTVWVSLIAAGIKAVSPAGAKINPTIAITIQGFLFTLGAMALRWSRSGVAFGAFLVGMWAALQGLFIQVLLLGKSLEKAWDAGIHFIADRLHVAAPSFWVVALLLAAVNGCISAGSTLIVTRKQSRNREKLEQMMAGSVQQSKGTKGSAFTDLTRPMFWIPLVLVAAILFFAKEAPMNILWMALRAVAIVLALGGLLRLARFDRILDWMRRQGHWGPAVAMKLASARNDEPTNREKDRPNDLSG